MNGNQALSSSAKIPVGISSCLMGHEVRWDGGHKANSYILKTLGEYFDFRPFCPELDIGLGVPRKPMQLTRHGLNAIHCVSIDDETKDFTPALCECADSQRRWHEQLCGYILKKDSPSCGMAGVKVRGETMSSEDGIGVYAGTMMENFPDLPVEEEDRLGRPALRENFIQRVFAMARWQKLLELGLSKDRLVDFHARHKLMIMSHDPASQRNLQKIVAAMNTENLRENAQEYLSQFMAVLRIPATRSKHVNVLQYILGHLNGSLDAGKKQQIIQTIEKYRIGRVSLIAPITLLSQYVNAHSDSNISNSWYMDPYPSALRLQHVS